MKILYLDLKQTEWSKLPPKKNYYTLKGHWKYSKKVEINWNLDLGGKNKITDVFRFSEIALETT